MARWREIGISKEDFYGFSTCFHIHGKAVRRLLYGGSFGVSPNPYCL